MDFLGAPALLGLPVPAAILALYALFRSVNERVARLEKDVEKADERILKAVSELGVRLDGIALDFNRELREIGESVARLEGARKR